MFQEPESRGRLGARSDFLRKVTLGFIVRVGVWELAQIFSAKQPFIVFFWISGLFTRRKRFGLSGMRLFRCVLDDFGIFLPDNQLV